MNRFMQAVKVETYVGLRSSSSKLILFAPVLIASLQLLIVRLSEAGQQSRDSLLGRENFESIATSNAYGYFVDGMLSGLTILGLLLVGIAAYSFSNDKNTGSIRHLVIRGLSRKSVVVAKLVYIHLLAAASIAVLIAGCYTVSGNLWEFGPIVEDGFELISESEMWQEIQLGLRLALLPISPAIGFGLLVSVLSQSSTQALSIALGLTLAVDVFKSSLGEYSYFLYGNFQPSLLDQSYLNDVSRLVRGYSDVLVETRFFDYNLWVPLPSLVIFIICTLVAVNRIKL